MRPFPKLGTFRPVRLLITKPRQTNSFRLQLSTLAKFVNTNSKVYGTQHLVARTLRTHGWSADTTTLTGDQGVDVRAYKGRFRLVVQCKLYSNAVGNAAVQPLASAKCTQRFPALGEALQDPAPLIRAQMSAFAFRRRPFHALRSIVKKQEFWAPRRPLKRTLQA